MPNVYQNGLIQVRPQYSSVGDDTPENVLWIQSTFVLSSFTLAQLTFIAGVFDTQWSDLWQYVGCSSAHYEGSVLTDWSNAAGLEYSSVGVLTPVAGGGGSTPIPPQVAALLSYQIPERYKGGHPRTYLPNLGDTALATPSTLTTTVVNAIEARWPDYTTALAAITNANGGPLFPRIYRFRSVTLKAALEPIVAFTCQPTLATQRRRIRKVTRK